MDHLQQSQFQSVCLRLPTVGTMLPSILLLTLLIICTDAAIYEFQRPFQDYVNLTEGQVFSRLDSPLGISSVVPPIVAAVGSFTVDRTSTAVSEEVLNRAMGTDHLPGQAILHVWIFHETNQPTWDVTCIESEYSNLTKLGPNSDNSADSTSEALAANQPTHQWYTPSNDGYNINVTHPVAMTGVHFVFFKICDHDTYATEHEFNALPFQWHANLVFRNPYGYTPARIYGLMPFYGLETGLLGVVLVLFLLLMYRHGGQLITLHYALAFVMLIACGEALLMYNAWMQVNELGPALCYPYCKTPFLMAIVFSQLKNTLSRVFLLVVCMGLGVTRSTLPKKAWCAIVVLHVVFFSFSLNVDIQDVANVVSGTQTDQIWTMPAVLSDLIIIMWIFLAVSHTRKTLKTERQTLKLSMYDKLIKLLTYVTMVWFFFVVLLMLKQYGFIPWPWRYAWVWQAFGQLGYFVILCSVAWTWGPSNVSSQLAHSQQLATSEEDSYEMTGEELNLCLVLLVSPLYFVVLL